MTKQYFVNPTTGGHMILDAAMSPAKIQQFRNLVTAHGYQEVDHAHYQRLQTLRMIGEQASQDHQDKQ